jgi:CRP-like cAMP-binding protein
METVNLFRHSTDFESYPAGQVIFKVGEPGDKMYAVKGGEVEIIIGDKVIEMAGPGDVLGEMALIDEGPRSATAVAISDCQLVPIDKKSFTRLVHSHPYFALHVMKQMAKRLRR